MSLSTPGNDTNENENANANLLPASLSPIPLPMIPKRVRHIISKPNYSFPKCPIDETPILCFFTSSKIPVRILDYYPFPGPLDAAESNSVRGTVGTGILLAPEV